MTTFKEYKENLYLKNIEEIIINKKVSIRGKDVLILSFIKGNNCNELWTVERQFIEYNEEPSDINILTNREDLRSRVKRSSQQNHIHISQMKIQDKEVNFMSSQGATIEYAYGEQINIIKHFIDNDLLTEEWNDIDIRDIVFGIYEQSEEEEFPIINYDERINITLKIEEDTKEVLIEKPLTVTIGKVEKGTKIQYKDNNGLEDAFYLEEIIKYDLHKDTLEKIEANINNIEEEYREEYRTNMMDAIDNICPKNMDIVSMYYETEDNTQLRFYTKKHLESHLVYNESCAAMIWMPDENKGINGHFRYVEMLCPVEKDFDEEIEIELFSKYERVPMEVVSFEM